MDVEENYLQKAYCYFYLKDYISCYAILKKAAKYYLSTNQLELYLITENNRITVGNIICNNLLIGISLSERESIKQELNIISEYSLYANSYYNLKRNNPVSELLDFKYIYKSLYLIIEKGKKVDKEARTVYSIHTGKNAYEEIEYMVHDLYNYMQYNYLLLNAYSETKCIYTVFIDYILLSLSTKEESTDDGPFGYYNIVLNKLSRFDLVVIFRFLSIKEIKDLTEKHKICKIDLDDEASTYIFNVILNLNNSYRSKIIPRDDYPIFGKAFHILRFVKLSQEQFSLIYETINLLFMDYNDSIEYEVIISFLYGQYNERNDSFKPQEFEQLIHTICRVISDKANESNRYILTRILKALVFLLHRIAPDQIITICEKEKSLLILSLSDDELISVFSVVDEAFKAEIQNQIMKLLSDTKKIDTYYNAVINDVIQPLTEYENTLYTISQNPLSTGNNNLVQCANLLLNDKIIDRNRFIDLIKQDTKLSLIIDPENYDYSEFDPSILLHLTKAALKLLSSNDKAFNSIHQMLKDYFINNWDETLIKTYIEFFS